jgi:DNA-binding response OmpR family regulator
MSQAGVAPRILIVEDDFVIALDLATQLVGAGYAVCEPARTTAAALQTIDADRPDMALLDVNLGHGETSFDIARGLILRQVPFVFLTGYRPTDLPRDLVEAPVLGKPCPFALLQREIGRLVPG